MKYKEIAVKGMTRDIKKVIVASTNPVKINCVRKAFEKVFEGQEFEVEGYSSPSGVGEQPMTSEETLQGAGNRASYIQGKFPDADFWVGIEGGVKEEHGYMDAFAWMVVHSPYQSGMAQTASFTVPPQVAELVRNGMELGHADDQVFSRTNSKHKDGAVGLLTKGLIDRTDYYTHAMILALIPFTNPDIY